MLELGLEFVDVFEVAVDAGEADVGDGVDLLEAAHDELADGGVRSRSGDSTTKVSTWSTMDSNWVAETLRFWQDWIRPERTF